MSKNRNTRRVALWVLQAVLAALFLFAGGSKLAMPTAQLAAVSHMSGPFLKFIGVCEVAGGLGLVLPGLFRIRTGLTPLAAVGLVIIMIGATILTVATQGAVFAAFPFAVAVLLSTVAIARRPRPADTFSARVQLA